MSGLGCDVSCVELLDDDDGFGEFEDEDYLGDFLAEVQMAEGKESIQQESPLKKQRRDPQLNLMKFIELQHSLWRRIWEFADMDTQVHFCHVCLNHLICARTS